MGSGDRVGADSGTVRPPIVPRGRDSDAERSLGETAACVRLLDGTPTELADESGRVALNACAVAPVACAVSPAR
jgi:hypothetical protein